MLRLTKASLCWPRLTLLLAVILGALGLQTLLRTPLPDGADAYIGPDQNELCGTGGRAVVTTSLALELGSLGKQASTLQALADPGWLSAAAISAALVTELTVLPALLAVASRNRAQAGVPACTG